MMQFRNGLPGAGALACTLLFAGLGVMFIPYAGAQYDELLFLNAILRPEMVEGVWKLPLAGNAPTMLMSYLGTLKAALYAPVFGIFGMNDMALRLPALLCGAASVWIFFLLARRLAGAAAALLTTLLLATDGCYLLTSVFDWGPVALQHLCFVASFYCFVRFAGEPRPLWLFLGGLAAGLGLWDKALLIWMLAGFGVALVAVYPRRALAAARDPRLSGAALAGFVLGAAPLLQFNITHGWRTFSGNTALDASGFLGKTFVVDRTLDGSGLLGYLVREEPEGPPERLSLAERASLRLLALLHSPRRSWQHLLLVVALLAAPLACWPTRRRRVSILVLLGGLLAFSQMMLTKNAGGSVHHTILLFPLFHLMAALAAAAVFERFGHRAAMAVTAVFAVCAVSNLAVVNTYMAHFIACGPGPVWTDASRAMVKHLAAQPGRAAFPADWGMLHEVIFYGGNRIALHPSADGIVNSLSEAAAARELESALADPRYLFITYTEGREMFAGTRRKLLDFAAARGYAHRLVETIRDRHSAPIFEIHEFTR